MGSVMWRVASSALCKVCAIKYVTNVNEERRDAQIMDGAFHRPALGRV